MDLRSESLVLSQRILYCLLAVEQSRPQRPWFFRSAPRITGSGEIYRRTTRAHAQSMMALIIGTLAPLHKSPLQQLMSHLVAVTDWDWSRNWLQLSSGLHVAVVKVMHNLEYIFTDWSLLFPSKTTLAQLPAWVGHVTTCWVWSQSSQLLFEKHW